MIETYVGKLIKSEKAAFQAVQRFCNNDPLKVNQFMTLVPDIDALEELRNELIEEFGIEKFIGPPMTKDQHKRILEEALRNELDNNRRAAISKELRELNGWVSKPGQAAEASVTVFNGEVKFDKNNPAEAERIYMAVAGSSLSR